MIKLLVSACLLGENCKYNGGNNYNEKTAELCRYFKLIPVCPECLGGLETPRPPSEIKGGKVINNLGEDVTEEFLLGAESVLYVAKESNCPIALLKERSPSCGCGMVYDGSFSGELCDGNGITAQLLIDNEIQVFGESQIDKLIDLYVY